MPQTKPEWIALGYSVPAQPSRGRVYIWRRLQRVGAQSFRPGMAVLPNTRENLKELEELSERVAALGGEALLVELNFLVQGDNEQLRERFRTARAQEQQVLLERCAALTEQLKQAEEPAARTDLQRRLRKKLEEYSKNARAQADNSTGEIGQAASEVFAALRGLPGELGALLRGDKGDKP